MYITLNSLIVYGENKTPVSIDFLDQNSIIQGPSDTGKSYIIDCLNYCLGSTQIPRNIGLSDGYTKFILNFHINNEKYSIIRDYAFNIERIYKGFISILPENNDNLIEQKFNDFFIENLGLKGKQILTKSGIRSNVTLSALKSLSISDESRTLSQENFIGSRKDGDYTKKKSILAFSLLGRDDTDIILPPSTDEKNQLTGKIDVYQNELISINKWLLSHDIVNEEIEDQINKIDNQIQNINQVKYTSKIEINKLNRELNELRAERDYQFNLLSNIKENIANFQILLDKYESDIDRISATLNSHNIVETYNNHACPLCSAELPEPTNDIEFIHNLNYEYQSTNILKTKLLGVMKSTQNEELEINNKIKNLDLEIFSNVNIQENYHNKIDNDLFEELMEKQINLKSSHYFINKKNELEKLLSQAAQRKTSKPKIQRELSNQYNAISSICYSLLIKWGFDTETNVFIDEKTMDLRINQRERISYGKGKRAIFLTAYLVAIMQYAIENNHPHLGFIIIDSPLVTHKDPKIDKNDFDSIKQSVADNFYIWLSEYKLRGQIIIIENDVPPETVKSQMNFIEFTGRKNDQRFGFYNPS